eukprot:c8027_g1_i1 orf=345-575(+)
MIKCHLLQNQAYEFFEPSVTCTQNSFQLIEALSLHCDKVVSMCPLHTHITIYDMELQVRCDYNFKTQLFSFSENKP